MSRYYPRHDAECGMCGAIFTGRASPRRKVYCAGCRKLRHDMHQRKYRAAAMKQSAVGSIHAEMRTWEVRGKSWPIDGGMLDKASVKSMLSMGCFDVGDVLRNEGQLYRVIGMVGCRQSIEGVT